MDDDGDDVDDDYNTDSNDGDEVDDNDGGIEVN